MRWMELNYARLCFRLWLSAAKPAPRRRKLEGSGTEVVVRTILSKFSMLSGSAGSIEKL